MNLNFYHKIPQTIEKRQLTKKKNKIQAVIEHVKYLVRYTNSTYNTTIFKTIK